MDFLDEIVRRIFAASSGGATAVRREEIKIRQQFGGERFYVPKALVKGKVHSLAESLAAGRNLREAFSGAGVSRATGYRLISRKARGW